MPEGDFHYYVKDELYSLLSASPLCHSCKSERPIGIVRPDISLFIHKKPVAIEIQHSALGEDQIDARMAEYAEQNIHVLWIVLEGYGDPDIRDGIDKDRYPASALERYLHTLYFGRVYYYHGGLEVTPVHFDQHYTRVPAREWYDSSGTAYSGGGYDKRSKRLRVLNVGERVNIVKDFKATLRTAWTGGRVSVPACRLWIDRGGKWW